MLIKLNQVSSHHSRSRGMIPCAVSGQLGESIRQRKRCRGAPINRVISLEVRELSITRMPKKKHFFLSNLWLLCCWVSRLLEPVTVLPRGRVSFIWNIFPLDVSEVTSFCIKNFNSIQANKVLVTPVALMRMVNTSPLDRHGISNESTVWPPKLLPSLLAHLLSFNEKWPHEKFSYVKR